MSLYGAIEAGGTKFVCAVGTSPEDLRAQARFPTTTPGETLGSCIDFFRAQPKIDALGIGCFGPIELHRGNPSYGHMTTTPKVGWANADIVGPLQHALSVPVGFDTDVNGAVLGEARWGAAQGLDTAVYVTIGTGIGGGALISGKLAHGLVHPEMGHLLVPREPDDLDFAGDCPFHGARCWEGVASGPAIERRWGRRGETLPADHPAWDLEARYIASALTSLVLVLSPQRLILGGGVMQVDRLYPLVRKHLVKSLCGYVQADEVVSGIDQYLVPPLLGQQAGIAGALALAERAAREPHMLHTSVAQLS
ncbi:MAG TPA: ROK family protein [Polyangiaceae bacterium]|nr:ROK family protein [Polyangiaceae bacterium]